MIGLKRRFNLLQVRARAVPLPRALPRATMARREKESAEMKPFFPFFSRRRSSRPPPDPSLTRPIPSLFPHLSLDEQEDVKNIESGRVPLPHWTSDDPFMARLRRARGGKLHPRPRARSRPRRPAGRPPTRSDERVSPGRRRNTVCFSSAWPSLERVTGAASLETLSSRGRPRRLLGTRRSTSSDSTRSTRKISAAAPSTTSRP